MSIRGIWSHSGIFIVQNTSSSYPRSHPLSCPEVCSSQPLSSFSTCRFCPLRHFLEGEESCSAAHSSASDVLCSLWRSPAMSLLRTCFSSLIKARFPGRAVIQETTLPVASVQAALPDAAQPRPGLPPSNDVPPINLSEIRPHSAQE